jgi:hypothetical protein
VNAQKSITEDVRKFGAEQKVSVKGALALKIGLRGAKEFIRKVSQDYTST